MNNKKIGTKKQFLSSALFLALYSFSGSVFCQGLDNIVTIYSTIAPGTDYTSLYSAENNNAIQGYAIVREQRDVAFNTGINKYTLTKISPYIDPTTVIFKSLTDPEQTKVLSQEFRFDLSNKLTLLRNYIGEEITVEQNSASKIESFTGKLMSVMDGIILEDKNGDILSLSNYSAIRFPKLSSDFFTTPTLILEIFANKAGQHKIETSYSTQGLSWWTEYNAIFTEGKNNKGFLELSAWVNIINKADIAYNNVTINLMAGEQNLLSGALPMMTASAMTMKGSSNGINSGFRETPFFEYHLYSLGKKIDLQKNSIKQLELFPKINQIPVNIQYMYSSNEVFPYYGQPNLNQEPGISFNSQPETFIVFQNTKEQGLGVPLPRGRFRVNKNDASGNLLFIGESMIPHTSIGQDVRLKLGLAFDINIERKQINFTVDDKLRTMEETYELKIKNQKDKEIVLLVRENLFRSSNWKIVNNSDKFEKIDSKTIEFKLPIQKEGESELKYTVKYSW